MAEGEAHSLFSASGADGWVVCNPKPFMERGRRTSSRYADEGTAAHTLADWVLTRILAGDHVSADAYMGRIIEVEREENEAASKFVVDADMADHVDNYVNAFLRSTQGRKALRYAERKLHYNEALGVPASKAFGTGDGICIDMHAPALEWKGVQYPAGVEIQIHDLKYGMGVRVFADGRQMKLYALGVLQDFELVADFTRVRMTIHQPRLDHIDEHVMGVDELRAWAAEPRAAAKAIMAMDRVAAYHAPKGGWQRPQDVPAALVPLLKPSDKGCRFCDAKAICPALIAEVSSAVSGGRATKDDFKKLTVDTPADVKGYGDNWLAMFASNLDLIDTLTKAVRAEIDRRVLSQGKTVPGFKVVMGKEGDRAWKDSDAAEKTLKGLRLDADAIYTRKLISPPQAEKLLKKTAPATWQSLQPLIGRAEGRPAVVHESDPRPAYTGHKAQAGDFKPVASAEGAADFKPIAQHPFR